MSGRVLIHVRESSDPVAIYLLVASIEIELILLLCGLNSSEISQRVLEYIMRTLELLSPPAQKSTDPDRSHSISVISFLFLSEQIGRDKLVRLRVSYMLMMFSFVRIARYGDELLLFHAIVSMSGLFFLSVFTGLMVQRTSQSLRVSLFKLASRF